MDFSDVLVLLGIIVLLNLLFLAILALLFRKKTVFVYRIARDLARWTWRILRDPQTPLSTKLLLISLLAYLFLPIDASPDLVPLLGQLDDLGLLVLGLHSLLGPDRLERIGARWPGSVRTFEALRKLAFRSRA